MGLGFGYRFGVVLLKRFVTNLWTSLSVFKYLKGL